MPPDRDREPRAEQRAQHGARGGAPARSSPTSTTTPGPTRTGCSYLARGVRDAATTPASAARTSPPPDDGRGRRLRRQRAGRPDARPAHRHAWPSTSPAATWRSAGDALLAIGGFDPQFRVAGDDVDVCWRLQERGWTLGFSPAAMVWHHRRGTVRTLPGGSSAATAAPRRCSSASGRRSTTPPATCAGAGGSTAAACRAAVERAAAARGLRHLGHRPVPVGLPAGGGRHRRAPADARVVPADRGAGRARRRSVLSGRRCCSRCRCSAGRARAGRAGRPRQRAARRSSRRRRTAAPAARCSPRLLHLSQPLARLTGRIEHGLAPWRRWRPRRAAPPAPARRSSCGARRGGRPRSGSATSSAT